ncbi:MAG: LPS export ABC transporter permease LptG [Moraxellaceae bacterium]|nr:LPS export ABC transporter permease LptG [Moraxellaceae bacterium]
MRTLGAYLRREVLGSIGLVLLAFLALFAIFDFLAELDELGRGTYRLKHVIIYVLLTLPGRAYEVMPIAALIGTLLGLTILARNSEITVMRSSGVSLRRLLGSLLKTGTILVLLTLILGELIVPPLERAAQRWRLMSTQSALKQDFVTGTWMRDGALFINIRKAQPNGELEGIRLYEFDREHRLISLASAERGEFTFGTGWRLFDATQIIFLPDHTERNVQPELSWASELTPEMVSVAMVTPERMAIRSLYPYVRHMLDNNQRAGRYAVALWKKVIYPFASLIMIALALPFALGNQRSGNIGGRLLIGVMLGMGFHLLNGLFGNLGIINNWSPWWSASAPSLLFMVAAAALIWKAERR